MLTASILNVIINHSMRKYYHENPPNVIPVHELCQCSQKAKFNRFVGEVGKASVVLTAMKPKVFIGELVHEGLEKILGEEKILCERTIERVFIVDNEQYRIVGSPDLAGDDFIADIKFSMSDRVPREKDILQIGIYNWLYRNQKVPFLIYITPNGLRIFECGQLIPVVLSTLKFNVDEVNDVVIRGLIRSLRDNIATPMWSWECNYCIYSDICPMKVRSREEDK